jgi:hypothetical protein
MFSYGPSGGLSQGLASLYEKLHNATAIRSRFPSAMITVQIEHRKCSMKVEFQDGARVLDVRMRAAQMTGLDKSHFRLICKGRELSDTVPVSSLRSLLRRPVKIMLVETIKPVLGPRSEVDATGEHGGGQCAKSSSACQSRSAHLAAERANNATIPEVSGSRHLGAQEPNCNATDAVDSACTNLQNCAHKVWSYHQGHGHYSCGYITKTNTSYMICCLGLRLR